MFGKKLLKNYVSGIDNFMRGFEQKRKSKTDSQMKEIDKHQKIAYKRDNEVEDKQTDIWK